MIKRIEKENLLKGPSSETRLDEEMTQAETLQPDVSFDQTQINIFHTLLR